MLLCGTHALIIRQVKGLKSNYWLSKMWLLHLTHQLAETKVGYVFALLKIPAENITACQVIVLLWHFKCRRAKPANQKRCINIGETGAETARFLRRRSNVLGGEKCTDADFGIKSKNMRYKECRIPERWGLFVEEVSDIHSRLFPAYLPLQRSSQNHD